MQKGKNSKTIIIKEVINTLQMVSSVFNSSEAYWKSKRYLSCSVSYKNLVETSYNVLGQLYTVEWFITFYCFSVMREFWEVISLRNMYLSLSVLYAFEIDVCFSILIIHILLHLSKNIGIENWFRIRYNGINSGLGEDLEILFDLKTNLQYVFFFIYVQQLI